MNQWSRTRKRFVFSIILFAVIILIGVPLFFLFYKKPSCADNKQNGDETGIDCGGSCQLLCAAESLPLVLKGDPRILTVATSTYEVVAIIENPNSSAEILRAAYTFKLFGEDSPILPVKVITGETYIPKASTIAIFEGPFTIDGGVVPKRIVMEWQKASLVWQKNTNPAPAIVVKDTQVTVEDNKPKLDVLIENPTLETVSNIDLVALIKNAQGNVFAASKTFIENIEGGQQTTGVFSWPAPFTEEISGVEVRVRIFPDRSYIK